MGKTKWRRGGGKNSDNNKTSEPYEKKSDGYDTIVKKNELFEKYYRQLSLVDESEWDMFLDILKQPLPITFRLTRYKSFAHEILRVRVIFNVFRRDYLNLHIFSHQKPQLFT
jgi:multisite-specific tRNA:(cytosine-C5)-methyltransferase